jgi:hypothetical protein
MQKIKTFIFLFVICLLTYGNAINGEFILDDYIFIVDNAYIKHFKYIPLLFNADLWSFSIRIPEVYA